MLRHGPVAGSDDSQLFHTGTLTPSRGLQIEFQASGDGGGPDMALALETSDGRHRFGLDMAPGTNLRVQRKVTTGKATWYYSEFSPPLALENGAWYVVRLFAGDTGSIGDVPRAMCQVRVTPCAGERTEGRSGYGTRAAILPVPGAAGGVPALPAARGTWHVAHPPAPRTPHPARDTWHMTRDTSARTPGLTTCKYDPGTGHTLEARVLSGRVEMYVDGAFKAAWVDTTPAAAAGLALQTIDGTAAFDDVQVYGATTRSYYLFGAARVGERVTNLAESASAGDLYALHGDHLGSVSLVTDWSGKLLVETVARYFPFGAERGTPPSGSPTDFAFAGQRKTPYIKMISMGARWYLPSLGRWASADTIVPGFANPQNLNRFSYVRNHPMAYIDPSGHCSDMPDIAKANDSCWQKYYEVNGKLNLGLVAGLSNWAFDALENLLTWLTRGIHFENGATSWSVDGIRNVMEGLNAAEQRFGSWDKMKPFLGLDGNNAKLTLGRRALADTGCRTGDPNGAACAAKTRIDFHNPGSPTTVLFLHELGHVVDDWLGAMTDADGKWSTSGLIGQGWEMQAGGTAFSLFGIPLLVRLEPRYVGRPGDPAPVSTLNINEDFADTFASWVLGVAPYQNVKSRTELLGSVFGVP